MTLVQDRNAEQMSPARLALTKLLGDLAYQGDRVSKFTTVQREAFAASAREREAAEMVAAVTAAEQRDWDEWAATLDGPPPTPRTAEREAAMARLAGARIAAANTSRASDAIATAAMEAARAVGELAAERKSLVASVLVEEAQRIATQYARLVEATTMAETALATIRRLLFEMQRNIDAETVGALMRGSLPDMFRAQLRPNRMAVRAAWERLAERLASDPAATIEEHIP